MGTTESAEPETTSIKLFRKWSYDDVSVDDISLEDYIAVKPKFAVYLPHTSQRYQSRRFRKASCPIVERLVAALMFAGRNAGKKVARCQHCAPCLRDYPPRL